MNMIFFIVASVHLMTIAIFAVGGENFKDTKKKEFSTLSSILIKPLENLTPTKLMVALSFGGLGSLYSSTTCSLILKSKKVRTQFIDSGENKSLEVENSLKRADVERYSLTAWLCGKLSIQIVSVPMMILKGARSDENTNIGCKSSCVIEDNKLLG